MKAKLIILLSLTWCLSAQASSLSHDFRKLEDDAVAGKKVYQVQEDGAGFMWFYTRRGICRYDGLQMRRYSLGGETYSQEHIQAATKIAIDNDGILWVAVRSGNIFKYISQEDRFCLVCNAGSTIHCIAFDKSGRLVAGTDNGALIFEGQGHPRVFAGKGMRVEAILPEDDGCTLLGTDKGLYRYDQDGTVKDQLIEGDIEVTALFEEDGHVLAGTFSNGLLSAHGKRIGDLSSPIRKVTRHEDFIVAASDGEGLLYLDPFTMTVAGREVADIDKDEGLPSNSLLDLCSDSMGRLWVVSGSAGIVLSDDGKGTVRHYFHRKGNANSLLSDHVNTVFEDSRGRIWFGTDNGVSRLDPDSRKWKHFASKEGKNTAVILAIAEDTYGNVWVGGYGVDVFLIDPDDNIRSIKELTLGYVYSMHVDGDRLWLGGMDEPLVCLNTRDRSASTYKTSIVGDIAEAPDGRLLLATASGLVLFDKSSGHSSLVNQFGGINLEYPIRSLAVTSETDVYLATDGHGLLYYCLTDGKSAVIPFSDGLKDISVNNAISDASGRLWVTTESHLYCLHNGQLVNTDGYIGFRVGYYNGNSALLLSDGSLVFGTSEGAVRFNPDFAAEEKLSPVTPLLTDLTLLGDNTVLSMAGQEHISLAYAQNSFSIGYSALAASCRQRLGFSYILDGYDDTWHSIAGAGAAEYRKVPSGKYSFIVQAVDKYTGDVIGQTFIPIAIRAPWWRSGWACVAYLLAAIATVAHWMHLRKRREAGEMAEEKVRNFVNFAHDLKTPLTLVRAPLSELEKDSALSGENRENVLLAKKNTDRLMSMVNSLLDLRISSTHKKALEVSKIDVGSFLEDLTDEYYPSAKEKGLTLICNTSGGPQEAYADSQKLELILNNLLSNALKYTESGHIRLSTSADSRQWTIRLEDTGIGIPPSARKRLFYDSFRADNARRIDDTGYGIGLIVVRQVLRSLRGKIQYADNPAGGSVFTISLPLRYKEGKNMKIVAGEAHNTSSAIDIVDPLPDKDTILIAEDDPDMLAYLAAVLGPQYNILTADSGQKALDIAREKYPDIVITDVVMPYLRGDELCSALKGNIETSHIPVILLTALGTKENIISGLESGADDYIVKPFELSVLKARIKNILSRRQALRKTIITENAVAEKTEFPNRLDKEFITKVQAVVEEHVDDTEFAVGDLCLALAMSRTAFFNKIKSLTGQGPNDYIRIYRLNRAKELLKSGELTVAEVSDRVGFSDPKYFSVCFRKHFGTSPSRMY